MDGSDSRSTDKVFNHLHTQTASDVHGLISSVYMSEYHCLFQHSTT